MLSGQRSAHTKRHGQREQYTIMIARCPIGRDRRRPGRPMGPRHGASTTRSGPAACRFVGAPSSRREARGLHPLSDVGMTTVPLAVAGQPSAPRAAASHATRPARAPCTGEALCAEDMMSNPRSAVTKVLFKTVVEWHESIFSPPVPLSRFLASFAARRRSNFSPPKNNNVIQLEDQKLLRRLSYKNTGCHAEPAEYITPRRSDCRPLIRRALHSLAATL